MTLDIDLDKRNMRILHIEDQTADHVLIGRKIMAVLPQCDLMHAHSIQNAYTLWQDEQTDYDLILLDLNLPDGFGPNSVTDIKRFHPNTPIIVITGLMSNLTLYESLKKGASNIVSKKQLLEGDIREIFLKTMTAADA